MNIKATTGANLYIAKGASVALDALTETSVSDLGVTNNEVNPAHLTADAGTVTVAYPTAYSTAPEVDSAGAGSTWQSVGTLTTTAATDNADPALDLDNYCAYAFVTLARKQTAPETYGLTASCTVTIEAGKESNLNKSLNAGLIINNQFVKATYVPASSGTITYSFAKVEGLTDNVAYSACLVLWFEGEDENCFVNNAIKLTANAAAWSFVSD